MPSPSQTSLVSDEDHAAEVAKQKGVADNLVETTPQVAGSTEDGEAVVAEQPLVKLVPVDAVIGEYPVTLSLPNYEDIVFSSASDSAEVPPLVAEQVMFVDSVKVAD